MINFSKQRVILYLIFGSLLFSGCNKPEKEDASKTEDTSEIQVVSEPQTRIVADKIPSERARAGLKVEEGELKESGVTFEDGPVVFEDPVIEEMLRNLLGNPEGEVLRSDLQEIHAIYWRYDVYWSNLQSPDGLLPQEEGPWETKQPNTLADLSMCDNLQWMEFGAIEVPSLQPLCSLTQLETIWFEGASVTEEILEELSLLPELKELDIGTEDNWGSITDGSFLLPLADRLIYLGASGKVQWNPEVLAQMTKLEKLRIDNVENISFLTEMPELKELLLYASTTTDWSALETLQNLEELHIIGNMYVTIHVSLDDLRALTGLEYLVLGSTDLQNQNSRQEIIDALPGLKALWII